ncbi:MAG: helix-turn-helix domain-containing protein [Pirellulales bacterium]|nr:helix-turn-helix domain-containing protein [Pirellulales bacterium]
MILGNVVDYAPIRDYNAIMSNTILFSDMLRHAIETSEKSRYRISQETGIDAAILCHFVHKRRGMSLDSIDALCKCLDLVVVQRTKPATKKRKGK